MKQKESVTCVMFALCSLQLRSDTYHYKVSQCTFGISRAIRFENLQHEKKQNNHYAIISFADAKYHQKVNVCIIVKLDNVDFFIYFKSKFFSQLCINYCLMIV